jgi:hypothetical protein
MGHCRGVAEGARNESWYHPAPKSSHLLELYSPIGAWLLDGKKHGQWTSVFQPASQESQIYDWAVIAEEWPAHPAQKTQ